MPNLRDVARKVGLNPLMCPSCNKHCNTMSILDAFFVEVLAAVKRGEEVDIKNFGSFYVSTIPARTIKTPLMKSGSVVMGERVVLRFHQTVGAKTALNKKKGRTKKNV